MLEKYMGILELIFDLLSLERLKYMGIPNIFIYKRINIPVSTQKRECLVRPATALRKAILGCVTKFQPHLGRVEAQFTK